MKTLIVLISTAILINGVFGALAAVIYLLNSERGAESSLLAYGIISVIVAVGYYVIIQKLPDTPRSGVGGEETKLKPKHRYLITLGAAVVVYLLFRPEEPPLWSPYEVRQPVAVESYTRSDGTHVSGYDRAAPGDRAYALDTNRQRIDVYRRRIDAYKAERAKLIAICVGICLAGVFWAANSKNRSS